MKKKILLPGLAALFLFLVSMGGAGASTLTYDDFNDGALGTNLGGGAGMMSYDGAHDPTFAFTSGADVYEGAYALSLTYDFPAGNWCGYWSFFYADESGYDVGGYTALQMWVKGASGGEKFKVELKDTANNMGAVYITTIGGFSGGLSTGWEKLSIPLTEFSGVDLTKLKQINIVFDEAPRSGTVFIDLIEFATQAQLNQPPTASFTYSPSSPSVNEEVQFADQSTDSDGTILSWSWDFGDGGASTLQNPTHRYSSADTYTVTLTVTDNGGLTDTKTANIRVTQESTTTGLAVYDDFNDGNPGTNLGGSAGPMSPESLYDPTITFTSGANAYEGAYGLSLQYDFPSGQWCGYWSFFYADQSGYDVSGYTTLEIWVKGGNGGEKFKVEVADEIYNSENYASQYHKNAVSITTIEGFSGGVTTEWQKLSIPLADFTAGTSEVDLTKLKQISIVFDEAPRSGTIFIDLIKFVAENTLVSVSPSSQNVIGEESFTVEVVVGPATEIAGVQLDLHFDSSLVSVTDVEEGDLLSRGGSTQFTWQEIGVGAIRIYNFITGTGSVTTSGTFATIQMLAENVGGTSILQLTNVEVGNPQGQAVAVKTEDGEVTIIIYLDWDVNADNKVSILDFIPIVQRWGETGPSPHWDRADVYRDGVIDVSDMVLVAQHWTG